MMFRNRIVRTELMNPRELRSNPKNWRVHPKSQSDGLQGVLEDVGWVQNVILNSTTGHLIDGHLRIELALRNHETEVPVTVVELSQEEEDTVLTTLDPLGAMAKANHDVLKSLIQGLTSTNPAVRDLINRIQKKANIVLEPALLQEIQGVPQRFKAGDVWKLGKHLLMCGNCTDNTEWDKLMGNTHAELCFTSPPYNTGELNVRGDKHTGKKYRNLKDRKSRKSFFEFLRDFTTIALDNCEEVLVNIAVVEGNKAALALYLNHFSANLKDMLYWVKTTAAPHIQEGVINNRVEWIIALGDGKRKFKNANFQQGTCWNVIEGAGAGIENQYSDVHKATFPLYVPEWIVWNFTHAGNTVVDPFVGTGTTLIACEQSDRRCLAMDIDPVYCSITMLRFEQLTGQKGVKISG